MNFKGGLKMFADDKVTIICHTCGREATHDVSDFAPSFVEEFQQYQNLSLECPHCAAEGKQTIMFININIPEFEEDEVDVVEAYMDSAETNARRFIRNLMWAKRPDLKVKDRVAEISKHVEMNKDKIQKMREEGASIRAQIKGLNDDARKDFDAGA